LADLANNYGGKGGSLPFLVVFYWPDEWAFRVHPVNAVAREKFQSPEYFTEQEYVDRLYTMRGWTLQANLKGTLYAIRPKEWHVPEKHSTPIVNTQRNTDFIHISDIVVDL
jgi:hypothetical protein